MASRIRGPICCLLALVLGGCARPTPWHGDATFTSEERAAIEEADEWLAARTGAEPFGVVWDAPHGAEGPGRILRTPEVPYGGKCYSDRGIVQIGPMTVSRDRYVALAAHELAHYRGLGHTTEPGSLMWSPSPALAWTSEDSAACAAAGACR